MAEYIEREATIELLRSLGSRDYRREKGTIQDAIKMVSFSEYTPAADVAPVRHGHWIRPDVPNTRSYKWQCSECGQIAYWLHYGNRGNKNIICKYSYCPNCGAKMDGKDGDTNTKL